MSKAKGNSLENFTTTKKDLYSSMDPIKYLYFDKG